MRKKEKIYKKIKGRNYINLPLNEKNNPYWIPVVVKNRDYLIGFIDSFNIQSNVNNIPSERINNYVSSNRFNDSLINGYRIRDLSNKQLKENITKQIFYSIPKGHPDKDVCVLTDYYFAISCPHCNMYYSFKDEEEIPKETMNCVTCGKILCLYTKQSDNFFSFDGKNDGRIETIVDEIIEEFED